MAVMLAPYNSAMRLGMGFNSYTQSLCVNDVVRKPGNVRAGEGDLRAAQLTAKTDAASGKLKQIAAGSQEQPPESILTGASGSVSRIVKDGQKDVSQVVSWVASFIDNSSDVLEKLEVSGALSIKMAGLGQLSGKASFVDSSDIKKADIKYLVHVKVVNQRLIADNVTEFAPIDNIQPGQFTEIYGDCFISGFIEGGEFDAIVTITTATTMKKLGISGELELSANISGIDVAGKVGGGKNKDETLKDAKTTISVTWSGGGDIRDDETHEWTLESLKKVAMGFPDAVAACPQRISAILTKYTSLRSYHEQTTKGSPLDYENAGVYTAALYDAYTDYKLMWKEIQAMVIKLNRKEIVLFSGETSTGLQKYAEKMKTAGEEKKKAYDDAIVAQKASQDTFAILPMENDSKALKRIEEPLPANSLTMYDPDIFGLEIAAADCRFEMIKIVREVDAVTKDPKVASDPSRTSQYLSPSIFKLLVPTPHKDRLPTLQEWGQAKTDLDQKKAESDKQKQEIEDLKKTLEAALITPKKDHLGSDTLNADPAAKTAELHSSIQTSLAKNAYRADVYRMHSLLKDKTEISTGATFFNDLDGLQAEARPLELRIWSDDKKIKGISLAYTKGDDTGVGKRDNNPQHVLKLNFDEVITELEVHVTKSAESKFSVTAIAVATSKCNILTVGTKSGGRTYSFSMADYHQWSFRGFFGFTFDDGFEDLGVVWGKDTPIAATSTVQMPPAKNLLGMGKALQEKTKQSMSESKPAEHFYLGDCISTGTSSSTATSFSALDIIVATSKMEKMSFSVSGGRLSGLKIEYTDKKEAIHGSYTIAAWSCEVKTPIVAAKISVGKTLSAPEPFIDTVELVCGDKDGNLPLWPLDVSTIRYLGDHPEAENLEIVGQITEQAPKLARANWTLRGFYGEQSQGLITRLGFVWGCV